MNRRRKRLLWLAVFLGLAVIAVAAVFRELEPERHFAAEKLPVLALPSPFVSSVHAESEEPEPDVRPGAERSPLPSTDKSDEGINVLLLGIDSRAGEASRGDMIILARVVPEKGKVWLISVPRDTRVAVPNVGFTKLNHVHLLGEERAGNSEDGTKAMVQAVSNFFQVPIHYYVKTDFNGFMNTIDTLGGIEVDLPQPVVRGQMHLSAGKQEVDGATALTLARERFSLPNGDFDRQVDQAVIIRGIVKKLLEPKNAFKLREIYGELKQNLVDTNFSLEDMMSLALLFKGIQGDDIIHVALPGKALVTDDPLVGRPLWYWEPDPEGVRKITEQYLLGISGGQHQS